MPPPPPPPPADTFGVGSGAMSPASPSRSTRELFFAPTEAGALAPLTGAACDTIDENLLLAETEELLAALDATAFISSPVSTEDDDDDDDDSSSSSRFAFPLAPQPAAQVAPATTTATIGKKRVRSRDRTKDELVELRRSVVDMEKHLVALRRNTTVVGKGKRNVVQTWEHIALRQLRGRERAEQENQQLKAMLLGQLSIAGRLDQSSNKRQLTAFPDAAASRPSTSHRLLDTPAYLPSVASSAAVMEALIDTVDTAYEQLDAVFKENEMDQWRREPRAYAQTKTRVTRETGEETTYLELVEVRLIPFDVKAVGDYLWQSMRSWHEKHSSYSFPCTDRPDDTFAVSYRVESRLGPSQDKYSAAYKLVKRRYVRSDEELVVVWKSRSDGDKALAGFATNEVGWIVVTAVPAVDDSAPPMTALRACVHICPQQTSGGSGGAAASPPPSSASEPGGDSRRLLTDLVMGSFENDVNSINLAMENLLMDDLRRPVGSGASVTSADDDADTERVPPERIHYAAVKSEEPQ